MQVDQSDAPSSYYKGYGKMSESTQAWSLSQQEHNQLFNKTQWVVTEKLHGANCSFVLNAKSTPSVTTDNKLQFKVHCGKRRSLLLSNEEFFDVQSIMPQMTQKLNEIHELIQSTDPSVLQLKPDWITGYHHLYVFGELFGGYYPSVEQGKKKESDAIQSGIWYSPNIEYCAFDIAIQLECGTQYFLDYSVIQLLFGRVNMMYNEPLFIGKFEQCMDYNIHFVTKIPGMLSLPPIEGNKAEGVVICPVREITVNTKKGMVRPLMKRKIEEFSEARFDMKQKQSSSISSSSSSFDNGISAAVMCEYEMQGLVTMNRLNNAISKLGKPDANNKAQNVELLELYVSDVLETLADDGDSGPLFHSLTEQEKHELRDKTVIQSKQIIYEYYKQQQKAARQSKST